MIIVAGKVVADATQIAGTSDLLKSMMADSLAEAGCIDYALTVDANDPGTIRIFEKWQSDEALAEHFQTPHMAAFQEALGSVDVKSMDVKVYTVTDERPIG